MNTRKVHRCLAASLASALCGTLTAQEFNIDFNGAAGTPSAIYGAASGQAGVWNGIGTSVPSGPLSLVNTAGIATSVTMALSIGPAGWNGLGGWNWNNPLTSGDDQALMDDIIDVGGGYPTGPVSELVVTFSGLAPATYEVYTYSMAPDNYLPGNGGSAWTTRIEVLGSSSGTQTVGTLDWPAGGHTLGQTYAQHSVIVGAIGTLTVKLGAGAPDLGFGSLNGIQIVEVPPAPIVYCTAGTSTNGCLPSISANLNPTVNGTTPCQFSVSNIEGQRSALFFYGIDNTAFTITPWASGSSSFLCVKPPTQRAGSQSTGGINGQCNGTMAFDWNAYQAANLAALGQPWTAGEKVYVQAWYRDPAAVKTTNLTNALDLILQP